MKSLDARLRTLRGRGSLTFESPEMTGSAAFDVSLRKPDSLLLALEGPFGIQVGTFFLSHDRFFLYNSLQNTVRSGSPTSASLASFIPVALTPDQVIAAFSGTFPLPSGEPESMKREGNCYLQQYRVESRRQYFWIEEESLIIRKFRIDDADGSVLVEGETSGTIERDGVRIPRRMSITLPGQDRRLAIAFSSAELNTPNLDFSYTVPTSARPEQ
jgi:hypothetical protein